MTGNAGTITLNADDTVALEDDASFSTASTGGVHAGMINLDAGTLKLSDEAFISSTSEAIGDAGMIHIGSEGTVTLEDDTALTTATSGYGKAGNITLEAVRFELSNRASVLSASKSAGKGGDAGTISIHALDAVYMKDNSSVSTSTQGEGNAGNISMDVARIELGNGASVSSSSNAAENGGTAGLINISAKDAVRLSDGSSLTTEAVNTASPDETDDKMNGKMTIQAGDLLYLSDSEITTSVKSGQGDGGDIEIGNPQFVILNHGKIKANAYEGQGGSIHIVSDQFIQSSASIVSASSQLGIDGSVEIDAPDEDVSGGLTILPANFLDAARWMKTPCTARTGEKVSRFVLTGPDALSSVFDDLQPSPPMWPDMWLDNSNKEE